VKKNIRAIFNFGQQIILFLLIFVIGSSFNELFSQNIAAKPTRQSSLEAFSKGNYEQAYNEFSQLLLTYSKDPLYKYYSGVCLVKLNRDPDKATALLQQALQGAAVVRSLPSDGLFYLGRAQQMSGRFTEAVVSYNSFTEQVGKKAAREYSVPELIQQCNGKKGQITEPEIKTAEIVKNDKIEISQKENKPPVKEIVLQPVEKNTSSKSNLDASYDKVLDEALDLQFKADSLNSLAAEQKKELAKLPNAQQAPLREKISENELLAASFQRSADQKYSDAQSVVKPKMEQIPQKEIISQPSVKFTNDSVRQSQKKVTKNPEKQSDTIKRIVPAVKKTIETFAFFEVLAKPLSVPNEKITINPEVPAGLIYRIQIAVFRNPVTPAFFKGITPVYGFKIPGTDKTSYYAGMFRKLSDARKALLAVKAKGFKDAFIVALSGKKTVSSDRAKILEKEWGKKPFISVVMSIPETPADTIPPTLSFRVEVIRSVKPLKEDIVEGIKKIAGSRGLDIQPLDDEKIVYLIGKFITFESAAEYADLLIRNGYREARVVAWMGKKEIPVETARQLFDNLK
jgi:hypothetical protein